MSIRTELEISLFPTAICLLKIVFWIQIHYSKRISQRSIAYINISSVIKRSELAEKVFTLILLRDYRQEFNKEFIALNLMIEIDGI